MPHRLYRSFQALLLLALCIFFVGKLTSGQLTYYINLRFMPLTVFGVIFLAILAQTLFNENKRSRQQEHEDDHHDHDHAPANLWFMIVPLAIGVLIPARPLDSSAFATKGFNTTGPMVSSDSAAKLFETEAQDRNVLDWVKISFYEKDLTSYLGQQASVIGFVYRDEQLNENQFYVSRFIISCCAADASSIGMIANWPDAKTLEKDSWVLVKGEISTLVLKDQTLLVINVDSVQSVPIPEQPYLYP